MDSVWRNRDTFVTGRAAIVEFLRDKWSRERDHALRKNLWAFDGDRIAVRFQYECRDNAGQWWSSYGNELWEFDGSVDEPPVLSRAGHDPTSEPRRAAVAGSGTKVVISVRSRAPLVPVGRTRSS